MQVVTGYQGQNEINLAVERGEVQGNNTGLSNLTVNKADWLRDGKVRILLQFGSERLPPLKDVPTVVELAASDEDRAVLRFYALEIQHGAARCIVPPDVPAERTRRAAGGVRGHDEGSRTISRKRDASGSTPIGSAARRISPTAGPADPGDPAVRGRPAARPAGARGAK